VLIIPKIAAPLQNLVPIPDNHFPHLQGLPLAHPVRSGDNLEITLLIGADFYWNIVQDRIIRGNSPTAVESKIGYLLSGPLSHSTDTNDIGMLHVGTAADASTHIDKFWDVEFTGTLPTAKSTIMSDQQLLTAYINSSLSQGSDGSYIVNFPWIADHSPLPSNRNICERLMQSLTHKLAQTPELLKVYGDIISDQVKRGFIEKVRESDVPSSCHFIMYRAVKKQSNTTPVKIVYGCSCCQSPHQPSLNDCLDVGPPFLVDLCTLLLRFQTCKFVLVTDIEKAFLHMQLAETDQIFSGYQIRAILKVSIYKFRVVFFGSAALHSCCTQLYTATSQLSIPIWQRK